MEVVRVVGLAIVGVVLLALVRRTKPEIGVVLAIACGAVILIMAVARAGELLALIRDLAVKAGVDAGYTLLLLRVIAIAFVTEFGAQVCRDAGEEAVARAVEITGKIMVLIVAVPVVKAVLEVLASLLPEAG